MNEPPGSAKGPHASYPHQSFWLWVMCLTGVDYFSTLGYQPSIAVQNTGMLAPLATVVLVLVTLLGALPVYGYVARRSFEGQGSIGMLARLVSGWPGKIMVLVLLGFAATDFVITQTLSAADAGVHLIENPIWPWKPPGDQQDVRQQIVVTTVLLVLLGATFMRGFREVIGLAVVLVGTYLVLNLIVIGAGLVYLAEHPEKFWGWVRLLEAGEWHLPHNPFGAAGGGWLVMIAAALLLFPKLALGLSGFETGVAVMSHVRGRPDDDLKEPTGRIRNTKKLLITAAAVMSVGLLGSSLVISTLVPPSEITPVSADGELPRDEAGNPIKHPEDWPKKPAAGRALAYIAHAEGEDRGAPGRAICPLFGPTFGTIYDISTIVILWFAGASAMAGLLNLVPKYLPRYGMAPEWAQAVRPLVLLFTGVNLLVTYIFRANVDAQGGAYATGVLVLITSACVATVIDKYQRREGPWYRRLSWEFVLITAVFVYTTIANEIEKGFQGLTIASFFILAILLTSFWSRITRSRELRFAGFRLADPESRLMWDTIRHLELTVLVPHRPGRRSLANKEAQIRREHRIPRDLMIVFVQVELADASEFVNEPVMKIEQEEGRYVMKISGAASISHTLAALALEMAKVGRPPEIHFGWTDESPVSGTLGFLLFGEGNVPWMVRELIRKAEPEEPKRPLIIIAGSS
ncbi:MAG TPA: amino acid transporter [Gemmataceae bacterium]|nr:amino acid transporter [Gemmataceae bacterium]